MPHSLIAFQNFPFFSQSKIEKNSFQHKTPSVPQIKQKYSTDFWFFLAENTNIIIYVFFFDAILGFWLSTSGEGPWPPKSPIGVSCIQKKVLKSNQK